MINSSLFLLGISVGSFLNVLIDRIPNNKPFLKDRSHCDFCNKPLYWYDLIPLLSFILLKGRCRFCHKKLSYQYPIIEFLTGMLFVITYVVMSTSGLIVLIGNLIIISGLTVLFMMDLKYGILADEIIFSLLIVNSIILIYQYMIIFYMPTMILQRFLTAILVGALFLILAIVTKGKGMGGGDVKLAFVMGLILSFPNIIIALYMAFISGGIIASVLLILKKKRFGQTIPFGPFLALSTMITIFFGDQIWLWYAQKFLGW